MASSRPLSDVWDCAKCVICLEYCTKPKALPCIHTFCLACLEKYWKDKASGSEVTCPMCRRSLRIPEGGPKSLNDNYIVQRMVTAHQGKVQYNILLMGETGVGKSMFVNGFANYLKFASLEAAEQENGFFPVPVSFPTTDPNTYQKRIITVGEDANETPSEEYGSVTQFPQSYFFEHDNVSIHLIDTPGISDTRGREKDDQNMRNILDYLSRFSVVHAICLFMKPDETRLNEHFVSCIGQLFNYLHVSASRNLMFCFTNARVTDYIPGRTMHMLKSYLSDFESIRPILDDKDAYFCFDNEPVMYLAAKIDGVNLGDQKRRSAETSWEKAYAEARKLYERIKFTEPHDLANTLSLHNVRLTIESLIEPLIGMTKIIVRKIGELERVDKCNDGNENVQVKDFELRTKVLIPPVVVCRNACCVRVINGEKTYKSHCQSLPKHVGSSIVSIFRKDRHCPVCKCGSYRSSHCIRWSEPDVYESCSGLTLAEVWRRKEQLIDEQSYIIDIIARLSVFLRTNAMLDKHGEDSDVLNAHIANEIKILEEGESDEQTSCETRRIAQELKTILKQIRLEMDAQLSSRMTYTIDEADGFVKLLYDLPLNGMQLKYAVESADKARNSGLEFLNNVKRYNIPGMSYFLNIYKKCGSTNSSSRNNSRKILN